jgi:hypothetical protein
LGEALHCLPCCNSCRGQHLAREYPDVVGSSKVITDDMAREIRDRLRAELERRKAALREAG